MKLYLLFSSITLLLTLSIIYRTIKNGISPMPSSNKATKAILSLIPGANGSIYELGSGWGTLGISLAKNCPTHKVIGFENSLVPYYVSRLLQLFTRLPNLTFKKGDFFEVPLNDTPLVVCYLYPGAMKKLKEKFNKELQSGSYVISNTFAIPGWKPIKVIEIPDLYRTKVYLYILS